MKPRQWRDAIRDSDLDTTAKHVAHVISTYMDGGGDAYPGKATIAKGVGLKSVRAVDYAVIRIERAGYIEIVKSKGGRPNHYLARTPNEDAGSTPHDGAGSTPHLETPNPASDDTEPRTTVHETPHGGAPESGLRRSSKRAESGARAPDGDRAPAPARQRPEEWGTSNCTHKGCTGLERCKHEEFGPQPPEWFPRKMPA